MTYTLYKITHRETGRAYIGMTQHSLHMRWKLHVSAARPNAKRPKNVLHRAILECGADAFSCEELETVETKAEAVNRERAMIDHHVTMFPDGFNSVRLGLPISAPPDPDRQLKAISVYLPESVWRETKVLAAKTDSTIDALMRRGLDLVFAEHKINRGASDL